MDLVSSLRLDAFTCVAFAVILIYVPHAWRAHVVIAKHQGKGPAYDLRNPRQSVQLSTDATPEGQRVARLSAAHQNGFEQFPIFAAAVLMAKFSHVQTTTVDAAATFHLLCRALYIVVYANNTRLNIALLRSTLWFGQIGTCLYLMYAATQKQ